jgi:lipopolysaccharide transport system ATP-binding protein
MDTLLSVSGLYKKFTKSLRRSLVYGTLDMAKSMVGVASGQEKLREGEFWALQDINFELKRGETLGLIGQNGCGKSTLLRMINGIFPPDRGRIEINGRIGALIAVGAGFHPHMSGRENIFLNGTILGMTKNDIKNNFDEIIDFAEIGDFLDAPVATYSSGMTVRLGFSIAISSMPDILLVDEILAVGDVSFVGKCFNKIKSLHEGGTGIILVSHSTQNLLDFCQRGILLNYGHQIIDTSINQAIKTYEILLNREKLNKFENKKSLESNLNNVIHSRCYIKGFENVDDYEIPSDIPITFCYEIKSEIDLDNSYVSFVISTPNNLMLININNYVDNLGAIKIKKGYNLVNLTIDALRLEGGSYPCYFVLFNRDDTKPVLDHVFLKPSITIRGQKKNDNLLKVERKWEVIN